MLVTDDDVIIICNKHNSVKRVNPLMGTLKPHSNGPLFTNTVIDTLAVDGWAVTFGTARRGLGGGGFAQSPPRCTKCNTPPITHTTLFAIKGRNKQTAKKKKRNKTSQNKSNKSTASLSTSYYSMWHVSLL